VNLARLLTLPRLRVPSFTNSPIRQFTDSLTACYIYGWQVRVRLPEWAVAHFLFLGVIFTPSAQRLERVREAAERVARSYGLEVFDVQLRRESVGTVLRVIIDRPDSGSHVVPGPSQVADPDAIRRRLEDDSVGIADCQRVSQDLSAILDVEEDDLETGAIGHAYTLEVSSPGLDRPLRHEADYRRFQGRLAKVVTSEPINGQSAFAGRLAGVDGGNLLLEEGRRMHRVPMARIKRARLEVEF
jgi:ribosome maturation factor RimP